MEPLYLIFTISNTVMLVYLIIRKTECITYNIETGERIEYPDSELHQTMEPGVYYPEEDDENEQNNARMMLDGVERRDPFRRWELYDDHEIR